MTRCMGSMTRPSGEDDEGVDDDDDEDENEEEEEEGDGSNQPRMYMIPAAYLSSKINNAAQILENENRTNWTNWNGVPKRTSHHKREAYPNDEKKSRPTRVPCPSHPAHRA